MFIISFTGKSGTGKSYQAMKICRDHNIDAIIDDGLLIYHNRVVAGRSAKRCESKAEAMRTALFNYDDHKRDVKLKLSLLNPNKLMIIGTSDRMVDWITRELDLPSANKRLYINDFTTEKEREIASISRNKFGEHVIPVPMVQIKKYFPGYFMHPIRILRNFALHGKGEELEEPTVVRPQFSYFGKYEISEKVIEDIIKITANRFNNRIQISDYYHSPVGSGLLLVVKVKIKLVEGIIDRCSELQWRIKRVIEEMTAFELININIEISEIIIGD